MLDSPSNPSEPEPEMARSLLWRAARKLGSFLLLLAVLMFVPAGVGWSQGWLFLGVLMLQMVVAMCHLCAPTPPSTSPAERSMRAPRRGTRCCCRSSCRRCWRCIPSPQWSIGSTGCPSRHGWWLSAMFCSTAGMACSVWAEQVNRFAEPGVRIQSERGHRVVDTGPYAIVRHPMYLAAYFLSFGIALALGSLWA